MEYIYLLKPGELHLKGGNRHFFEKKLKDNIKRRIKAYKHKLRIQNGRMFLEIEPAGYETAEKALRTTAGLVGFSRAIKTDKDLEAIKEAALHIARNHNPEGIPCEFKVNARRADKSFPMTSYEIAAELGGLILENCPGYKVNVRRPEWTLEVELRDRAYIYEPAQKSLGGLPVGVAGRGTLLLSGGIDSPVAGCMMAARGLKQDAIYFHTYPYTSDDVKDKIKTLCTRMAPYMNGIRLYIVPFTPIQMKINKEAPAEAATLMARSAMMKIADLHNRRAKNLCLVTGESLGQVASQTPESLRVTGAVTDYPVFRPLIGLDKEFIIRKAREIDTFETSTLPYEDCCSLFAPKHPLVRPDFAETRNLFKELEDQNLFEEALNGAEEFLFGPEGSIFDKQTGKDSRNQE